MIYVRTGYTIAADVPGRSDQLRRRVASSSDLNLLEGH